jgi:hypothetical protein
MGAPDPEETPGNSQCDGNRHRQGQPCEQQHRQGTAMDQDNEHPELV